MLEFLTFLFFFCLVVFFLLRPIQIWRYFTGIHVVLQDFEGRTYNTVAIKDAFENIVAPVYFWTGVGSVLLHEDGTCTGESCYIKRWIHKKSILFNRK